VARLGATELLLFWRNKTALLTALSVPIIGFGVHNLMRADGVESEPASLGPAWLATAMIVIIVLFVVYYNLVTAYVARREELVLKRLRAGEARDGEILAGAAAPAVVIALFQTVLVMVGAAVAYELAAPVNAALVVLGVVAGIVICVLLAAISTAFTRSVELAQVSTLPVLMVCMFGSGALVPLEAMPDAVRAVARFVPLTPVVDLLRLGWLGTADSAAPVDMAGTFARAVVPLGIIALWVAVGVYGMRRWFRWEPRR
jgi:ABC-2 type transport system permease protein